MESFLEMGGPGPARVRRGASDIGASYVSAPAGRGGEEGQGHWKRERQTNRARRPVGEIRREGEDIRG